MQSYSIQDDIDGKVTDKRISEPTEFWECVLAHHTYSDDDAYLCLRQRPRIILDIERNAAQFKLEGKRERSYPRGLKVSKNRYLITKSKYAVHLK